MARNTAALWRNAAPAQYSPRHQPASEFRDLTMKSPDVSRRQFLKGSGAFIVSFSLFPALRSVFAQSNVLPNGDLDPAQLDSWLAIGQDDTVTLFTSKVDLGTGIVT